MREINVNEFPNEIKYKTNLSISQKLKLDKRVQLCGGMPKSLLKLAMLLRLFPLNMI